MLGRDGGRHWLLQVVTLLHRHQSANFLATGAQTFSFTSSLSGVVLVVHSALGTSLHSSLGTCSHTCLGSSQHFSRGSSQHFSTPFTVAHSFSVTVVHCFSVTVVHTSSYLVLHSFVYLVTHTSSSICSHCSPFTWRHSSSYLVLHSTSYLVEHFWLTCSGASLLRHIHTYFLWHRHYFRHSNNAALLLLVCDRVGLLHCVTLLPGLVPAFLISNSLAHRMTGKCKASSTKQTEQLKHEWKPGEVLTDNCPM